MKIWILFLVLVSTQMIRGSTAPPAVYQVKEGDSFTFRWDVDTDANMASTDLLCTQLSRPPRTLYELVQGLEFQGSQHQHFAQRVTLHIDALRANQIRLHLSRVNMADTGRYLCDVRADYNKRTRTWRLSTSKYFVLDVTSGGTRGPDPDSPESRPGRTACDSAVAFTIFFLPLVALIAAFIIVDRAKPMKRRYPDQERNSVDRIRLSSRRHNSGSAGDRKKHPVSKPDLSPDASQKKCHIIIGTTVIIIGIILTITTWTLNLKRLCFFNK